MDAAAEAAPEVIAAGIDLDDDDEGGDALLVEQLFEAILDGDIMQVGALLDQGVDIEARRQDTDESPLDCASSCGLGEVVALLLDRGADINAVADAGQASIMHASKYGQLEVVKLLHARGANIDLADKRGESALHFASRHDRLSVCEFLLSKGADLNTTNNEGDTALSHYGSGVRRRISPETKALRCAALEAAHAKFLIASQRDTIETLRTESRRLNAVTQTTSALLFSDAFSDLVFACPGGERIHAHRNIVSASSPHARVLLQGPWAENAGQGAVVQMPQSAAAVRALLRFLYTGETDAAAIETSISDVLELASQREQPALTAACERHAMAALSVATVVPVLVAAHLHNLAALKAACVDLIKTNSFAVLMSKAYITLETTHPLLWRELRAALGLPEEEHQEEDEEEQERPEGQRKRARMA